MKQELAVLVAFLSVVIPARLFAKGDISKITIEGADLKTPIEIIDFRDFKGVSYSPWSGPGVSVNGEAQTEGFIIDDWSQPVTERPKGLQRYKVSFYAKFPDEKLVYVVLYEDDSATGRGYIYLPGTGDEWYGLNTGTIARGVEGHWFRARREWDRVARPLIAGAKVTASEEQPGLELRLQPEDVQAGVPEAFTFVLVNGSNHDVRVPIPSIECEDPPFDGNIRLKVEFRPLRPDAPGFGSGCTNDRMDDPPAIMSRVQNWKNLHPGESLSLKAVRKRLLYRYEEPGTYEFCAHYFPPSLTTSDREALNQAGIDFPQNELTSAHVTFVKEP